MTSRRREEFDAMLQRAYDEWNSPSRDQRNEKTLKRIEANTRYICETLELIRQQITYGGENND